MSAMSNKAIGEKNKEETLWQWAEKYADLKARQREVNQQLGENQKLQQKLRLEKATLQKRLDAIRAKRDSLVNELTGNNRERRYRSEIEDDPIGLHKAEMDREDVPDVIEAERQENFEN